MSKSIRLKTRAYLFEEEELKKSLPEIMFSTNEEIIFQFQFRRSRDKITPTQKIIACAIGHDHVAKCSGFSNCPENCILFTVKKPWIGGVYKMGCLTIVYKCNRKHITDLMTSWDSLKKSKNKNSKAAVTARQDF